MVSRVTLYIGIFVFYASARAALVQIPLDFAVYYRQVQKYLPNNHPLKNKVCETAFRELRGLNYKSKSYFLVSAIRARSSSWVKYALTCGADANVRVCSADQVAGGDAPLHWAARYGDKDMIEALLAYGAGIEEASHGGRTPLCVAAFANNVAAVRALLDCGADARSPEILRVARLFNYSSTQDRRDQAEIIALLGGFSDRSRVLMLVAPAALAVATVAAAQRGYCAMQ